MQKCGGGGRVHEGGLVGVVINGGDDAGLEVLTLPEIMDEDEATGGARPPDLIEEEVAETIIDGAVAVEFVGLGLVSGGAND